MYYHEKKSRIITREEAAILSVFNGITPMTDAQVANGCSKALKADISVNKVSGILKSLREEGLVRLDSENRGYQTGNFGYMIKWNGVTACAHINPFIEPIEEIDSLMYAISSDVKAATILSMDPSKSYSRSDITSSLSSFGINGVVSSAAVMKYFIKWGNGLQPVRIAREHSARGEVEWASARKEEWAQKVYDPVISRAIDTVLLIGKTSGRRLTLCDVFGPSSTPGKHAKGAAIYAIAKTLVTAGKDYTYNGLLKEAADLYGVNARHQINVMAELGLIDYSSVYPRGENADLKRSRYLKMHEIDDEEAFNAVISMKPYLRSSSPSIRRVITAIKSSTGWLGPYAISENADVSAGVGMKIMACLCKAGYLGRREEGGNATSVVRANQNTFTMWDNFLKPVGELAWFVHNYRNELGRVEEAVGWVRDEIAKGKSADLASKAKELVERYMTMLRRDGN